MKEIEKTVTAKINGSGGLMIFMEELNEFLKNWKNKKVVISFKVLPGETTPQLRGYYYSYVVPEVRRARWKNGDRENEEQTEFFLRSISPVTALSRYNNKTGKYDLEVLSISDLSNPELLEHIEFIQQMAAEEYSAYIDDPK